MEFISTISSHWELLALVVYLIFNEWTRSRREKKEKFATRQALKELENKLEKHIKESTEWRSKQNLQVQGQMILNSLAMTHPNCSKSRFEKIKHEFDLYVKAGGNGYVRAYYFDWLERRENSLKNLKQNKK